MDEITFKVYIGGGKLGKTLLTGIRAEAEKHFKGSVSKLFLDGFCKLYNYDPATGKPLKKFKK